MSKQYAPRKQPATKGNGLPKDLCAWPGCTRSLGMGDSAEAWSAMILISQNAVIEAILEDQPVAKFLLETPRLRDCMLCPDHAEYLRSLLSGEEDPGDIDL